MGNKPFEYRKSGDCYTLERKQGEGSNVGFEKKYSSLGEFVNWLRHLYAYRYVERFIRNKSVLDIGCGTGYGIHELSATALDTVGIDIWINGLRFCNINYGSKTSFLASSGNSLPFRDNSFDLVFSFQVIEHIPTNSVISYLQEIKRVLKDNGVLIVTTPNRRLRLVPLQKPWDVDHTREYDAKSLKKLLAEAFENVKIQGLFATKVPYMIEYNRVKPSPLTEYAVKPLARLAKRVLSNNFVIPYRRFGGLRSSPFRRNQVTISCDLDFSDKDFCLLTKNMDSSIDLFGTCIK